MVGSESPRLSAASIIKIELPNEGQPFIPFAAKMGAIFLHGSAVTIHKAQGSQWENVQVFAPDIYAAAQTNRVESDLPLWKAGILFSIVSGSAITLCLVGSF